ncbi:hypothetical protein B0H14DRAFT_2411501, partial [Mycena olivaceomarginata]
HCHYTTSLKLSDNVNVTTTLHIYSAAGDVRFPDSTMIFAVTKVYSPAGKPVELNALYISAIPGDITAKVGTEGATKFFLFWNVFREL